MNKHYSTFFQHTNTADEKNPASTSVFFQTTRVLTVTLPPGGEGAALDSIAPREETQRGENIRFKKERSDVENINTKKMTSVDG